MIKLLRRVTRLDIIYLNLYKIALMEVKNGRSRSDKIVLIVGLSKTYFIMNNVTEIRSSSNSFVYLEFLEIINMNLTFKLNS
jgi:hypothetical protein